MVIRQTGIAAGEIVPAKVGNRNLSKKEVSDGFSHGQVKDPAFEKMNEMKNLSRKDASKTLFESDKGTLKAVSLEANTLWDYKKVDSTACDTVYDSKNKTIYSGVGTRDDWYLTAFDTGGAVKWSYGDSAAKSSPVLDKDKNVFFRTKNGLVVLDPNGKEKWSYPINSSSWSDAPPAIGPDGTVYIISKNPDAIGTGSKNLRLTAVNKGKELWHYNAVGDYTGDPQVLVGKDNKVYLNASIQKREMSFGGLVWGDRKEVPSLIALNSDGTENWTKPVDSWPSYTIGSLSEGKDGTIYACHGNKKLTAFNPNNGKERWTYEMKDHQKISHASAMSRFTQAPVVDDDGSIFIGTTTVANYPEGYLVKLDKFGKEQWKTSAPGGYRTKPHFGPDGKIYIGTDVEELRVLDKQGNDLRSYTVGNANNFDFGDNGEIYLNTYERILALHPDAAKLRDGRRREELEKVQETPEETNKPSQIEVEDQFVVIGGVRLRRGKS